MRKKRGFARLSARRRKAIASLGGKKQGEGRAKMHSLLERCLIEGDLPTDLMCDIREEIGTDHLEGT